MDLTRCCSVDGVCWWKIIFPRSLPVEISPVPCLIKRSTPPLGHDLGMALEAPTPTESKLWSHESSHPQVAQNPSDSRESRNYSTQTNPLCSSCSRVKGSGSPKASQLQCAMFSTCKEGSSLTWIALNEEDLKRSFIFQHKWAVALLNSQTQGPERVSRCQGRGCRQPKIQDPPLIIFLNLPALFSTRIPKPGVVFLFGNPQQMSLLSIWLIFYWIHINFLCTQHPLARNFAELLPTARKPSPFVSIKSLSFMWYAHIFVLENSK